MLLLFKAQSWRHRTITNLFWLLRRNNRHGSHKEKKSQRENQLSEQHLTVRSSASVRTSSLKGSAKVHGERGLDAVVFRVYDLPMYVFLFFLSASSPFFFLKPETLINTKLANNTHMGQWRSSTITIWRMSEWHPPVSLPPLFCNFPGQRPTYSLPHAHVLIRPGANTWMIRYHVLA